MEQRIKILTNNDLRKNFIENFRFWPVLEETVVTGEKVYGFALENGAVLAVQVVKRHDQVSNKLKESASKYFILNVKVQYGCNKNEYFIVDGRTFHDGECNKSVLVDFIKQYQRGEVK